MKKIRVTTGYNDWTNTVYSRTYKVVEIDDLPVGMLDLEGLPNQPADSCITFNGEVVRSVKEVPSNYIKDDYCCFDIITYSDSDDELNYYYIALRLEDHLKYTIKKEATNSTWGSICSDDYYKSVLLDSEENNLVAIDCVTKKKAKLFYDDLEDELIMEDVKEPGKGKCIIKLNLGLEVIGHYDENGIIIIEDDAIIV